MAGKQEDLPVGEVELDRDNPRIRRFLESYEGELTDDRIALALDVAAAAPLGSSRRVAELVSSLRVT